MSQPNGRHGSHARVEQRVTEVCRWIVAGLQTPQIYRLANDAEHAWNVSRRTIDTYIAKATQCFVDGARIDRQAEIGKAKARYESDRAVAVLRGDIRLASSITEKIVELHGLKAPARLEIIDPAEARRQLEEEVANAIAEAESITAAASTGEGNRRRKE
jgi:hypothetical protein